MILCVKLHLYICSVDYYSALRINGISMHEKAWRQPKYMLLSETSQSGKFTDSMIQTIWHSRKCTTFGDYKKTTQ